MHARTTLVAFTLISTGLVSGAAQAALFDRGGGLIYDDVLNVTWLQDANYAKTSGYDADGKMTWAAATTWAANLSYYDSVRNVTYTDWRLPTMIDTGSSGCSSLANSGTDCGYNVQTISGSTVYSEMAHMYFNNLGLKSYFSPTGAYQHDVGIFGNGKTGGQNDIGPIKNLQSYVYWSGLGWVSEFVMLNSAYAWAFGTSYGEQAVYSEANELYVWAVRPGDVAAVPEADTWTMLLAGLGLISMAAKRRR